MHVKLVYSLSHVLSSLDSLGMIYNQGGQLDMEIQRAILLDGAEILTDVLEEDLVRATEFAARTLGE